MAEPYKIPDADNMKGIYTDALKNAANVELLAKLAPGMHLQELGVKREADAIRKALDKRKQAVNLTYMDALNTFYGGAVDLGKLDYFQQESVGRGVGLNRAQLIQRQVENPDAIGTVGDQIGDSVNQSVQQTLFGWAQGLSDKEQLKAAQQYNKDISESDPSSTYLSTLVQGIQSKAQENLTQWRLQQAREAQGGLEKKVNGKK